MPRNDDMPESMRRRPSSPSEEELQEEFQRIWKTEFNNPKPSRGWLFLPILLLGVTAVLIALLLVLAFITPKPEIDPRTLQAKEICASYGQEFVSWRYEAIGVYATFCTTPATKAVQGFYFKAG